MASADWTVLTDSLTSTSIARGVTAGLTPPNGGGSFVYAMNSLLSAVGVLGLYATPQAPNVNFSPMLSGGDIRGAIQRGVGGSTTGVAAMLFLGLGGNDVANLGYILGLADGDPCHIELRKGSLALGLPDENVGGPNKILARSSITVPEGTWMHLRLEMVCNGNGDTVLNCYMSDLTAHAVTSPVWTPIPGMSQFIDDPAGINSGSLPFVGGYAGFAARVTDATRRAYFDQIQIAKQL